MRTVILNGAEIAEMEDVHAAFAAALDFPEWYGRNLDALYDMLTMPQEPVTVVFRYPALLEDALGRRFRTLRRVLWDAAEENPGIFIEIEED